MGNQLTAADIIRILEKNARTLHSFGVRKIGLFGSFGRGTSNPDSDIDLLVTLDKPTFDSYMNLKLYLEDLFDCKVDLVMEETIKTRLRPYILEEVIYASGL